MSIRLPIQTVFTLTDSGTSSVATGTSGTFTLPQDTDNVVLKLQASITGGGVSAFLQTSDDGGTTFYDVGRTSVVSDATSATAQWLSVPVLGAGIATSVNKSSSLLSVAIGSATASTVGIQQMSGLPIMGQVGRVVLSYSAAGTANTTVVAKVMVNNQSATA